MMIKKQLSTMACVLTLSLSTAMTYAGELINDTLSATPGATVSIEHSNGKAKITGWARDEVQIKGELSNSAEKLIFKREGDDIVIQVKERKNWSGTTLKGDRLEIFVPQQSQVIYQSTNADVSISSTIGALKIDAVNGDVGAKNIEGDTRITLINGDIEVKNVSGSSYFETVNGDIELENIQSNDVETRTVNGDIEVTGKVNGFTAETVNGDIELKSNELAKVDVTTVNGDVEAVIGLTDSGSIQASSVSGDIELKFPQGLSANVHVEGHYGSDIVNQLNDAQVKVDKKSNTRSLSFTEGDGKGTVRISTVKGEVKISK
ncbi:DUF4097 family beta strand repeat-containing protein [Echinimonas agarilytica]|uniref:DUF4097 family beta strand repeat-containing protein n=1 Tax=Echinimonas agarilytica TaxID=1215918 RepID=A0AA41W9D9_9GAMM|nr:DUF4097 family beta strand repeat-containing protein [Echinimonas agarilytica]MCM2680594.1 DUF4097 family beta strand repeat-containing protein [Echinimonas agarilytica]